MPHSVVWYARKHRICIICGKLRHQLCTVLLGFLLAIQDNTTYAFVTSFENSLKLTEDPADYDRLLYWVILDRDDAISFFGF